MCSPAMGAMIGLNVVGGFESEQAQLQAAEAKKNYYDYLAGQNETQAKTVLERGEETATSISETSAIDENNVNRESRRVEGSQKAAMGASGTSGSVTAEDVVRDTNRTHQMDVDALRYDADSKIWATKTGAADQAKALRDQAAQFRYAGANAKYTGDINAETSLLGTATSVADTWYRGSQTGAGRSAAPVKTKSTGGGGYATAPDYGNA